MAYIPAMEVRKTDVFQVWLDGLKDVAAHARIVKRLVRIEKDGHLGAHHGVGDGVSELIFDFGPGYRVYYVEKEPGVLIIVLGGGDKDSQASDIEKAKALAKEV